MPTPWGVPVKMRSPGRSVTIAEMYAIIAPTSKMNSRVFELCTVLPFRMHRTPRLLGLKASEEGEEEEDDDDEDEEGE